VAWCNWEVGGRWVGGVRGVYNSDGFSLLSPPSSLSSPPLLSVGLFFQKVGGDRLLYTCYW